MSTTFTLIHLVDSAVASVPVDQLVRTAASLALVGGAVMFFRPLLVGLGRAAMLALRPRPAKASLAERH